MQPIFKFFDKYLGAGEAEVVIIIIPCTVVAVALVLAHFFG